MMFKTNGLKKCFSNNDLNQTIVANNFENANQQQSRIHQSQTELLISKNHLDYINTKIKKIIKE